MTDYLHALPAGYRIEEYELVRVLGSGGFGITYLGYDHHLDKAVAIKEYLPNDLAVRTDNQSVLPKSTQDRADYEWGLERFLSEAQTLARFDHRHIIKIHRFFRAHGTGYIVMEYAEGETLSEVLQRKGILTETELKQILLPILDGLDAVHEADFLHRDIKPKNIVIRDDGSPVLIDFGSARHSVVGKSRSVTAIVTPGYAPIEQYSSKGHQGPWTDIYALGAVCYRCLAGEPPDDATDRLREDPLIPAIQRCKGKASASLLGAIDRALRVNEEERQQTIAEWREALSDRVEASASAVSSKSVDPAPKVRSERSTTLGRARQLHWAWAMALVVLIIGSGVWWVWQSYSERGVDNKPDSGKSALPSSEETVSGTSADKQAETLTFTLTPLLDSMIDWDSIDMEVASSASDETLDDFERGKEAYSREDYLDAIRWFRKAAEQGHAGAQLLLGAMYVSGEGVAKDTAEAARWYRKAAEQGHAGAQLLLCAIYSLGEDVAKDTAEKARWCRMAAKQGHAIAQESLGTMYATGEGVAEDNAEAMIWYRKAAEQGYAGAQAKLGLMYDIGKGVVQDNAEAARWYSKAAGQGHAEAQLLLGVMYASGEGVIQDYTEAARWYRKAAKQGLAEAQLRLGLMYDIGEGIMQDYVAAYMWLNIATSTGAADQVGKARELRDMVAAQITPAEILEAQQRGRICLESNYQQCD